MRTFDVSPLYKSAIGYDRFAQMLDSVHRTEQSQPSYPPYNVEMTSENHYCVTMAVAGFEKGEIEIEARHGLLHVRGKKTSGSSQTQYLYKGIATRDFERKFQLADYIHVTEAKMANGLLSIYLQREIPESLKPRKIAIDADPSVGEQTRPEAA